MEYQSGLRYSHRKGYHGYRYTEGLVVLIAVQHGSYVSRIKEGSYIYQLLRKKGYFHFFTVVLLSL